MYFSLLLSKQEQSHLFQFPYIPLCKGFFINTFALEAFNLDTADGKQRERTFAFFRLWDVPILFYFN